MYAIVDIAGQQIKVKKDQKIFVNRLVGKEGSKVDFDQILLVDDNGKIQVGTPVVKDMVVSATIVSHVKGDKVKVFKKKKRKGYKVLNGHRQLLTELLIQSIAPGKAATPVKKAETKSVQKATTEGKVSEAKKPVPKDTSRKKESQPKTSSKSTAQKTENKSKASPGAKSTVAKKETKPQSKAKSATAKKPQAKKVTKPANQKKES